MPSTVVLPERAAGRREVAQVLAGVPSDLGGRLVTVDGSVLEASSSSFVDELVKVLLVERGANGLELREVSHQVERFAMASAQRRGVADRLRVSLRS